MTCLLRKGNAGSNTAADHITVVKAALSQLPGHRPGTRAGRKILIRTDGAGGTHDLLNWLVSQRLSYSVGFTLPDSFAQSLARMPKSGWTPAYNAEQDRCNHAAMTTVDRRATKWVAATGAVVVVALGVLGGLALYSHTFYRSPWQVVPSQFTACGRDYIQPDKQHPQTLEAASRSAGAPLRKVAVTKGWVRTRAIWAHPETGPEAAGDRCGTVAWLQVSSDHFLEYGLSGGP